MHIFKHKANILENLARSDVPIVPPGVALLAAPRMWPSTQGKDTIVAVLDTGIDYTHPDLKDNVIGGVSFVTYEKDYKDFNGHGTHVAGTIAARGKILGVAPAAKLLAVKVLDQFGFGSYQQITNGLDWVRRWRGTNGEKVNIVNMSLGGAISDTYLHNAIKKAVNEGICIVCAAGNEGDGKSDSKEISYPAYYPETIAVGAVDLQTGIANFSNSNDRIDIVAPGVDTYSTYLNGQYVKLSGTSMAAPHVSGSLALYYSRYYKRFGVYPEPEAVRKWVDFQSTDLGDTGYDELYGFGLFTFNLDGGKEIILTPGTPIYRVNNKEKRLQRAPFDNSGDLCGSLSEIAAILSCQPEVMADGKLKIYS